MEENREDREEGGGRKPQKGFRESATDISSKNRTRYARSIDKVADIIMK